MTWSFLAKMELAKAKIQTSIKTTWSLHKNHGKTFIVKHFMPAIKAKQISVSQIYRILAKLEKTGSAWISSLGCSTH